MICSNQGIHLNRCDAGGTELAESDRRSSLWQAGLRLVSRPVGQVGVLVALVLIAARPAQANCWAGMTQGVYGPDELITIDIGFIDFYPSSFSGVCTLCDDCDDPGVCDSYFGINVSARAYIVPHDSVSGGSEVSLAPLAIGPYHLIVQPSSTSGFIDEVIGITAPSGPIGDGTYDLIFDECEDGCFTPGQDCIAATFSVEGTAEYEPGSTLNPAIVDFKNRAAQKRDRALELLEGFDTALSALGFCSDLLSFGSDIRRLIVNKLTWRDVYMGHARPAILISSSILWGMKANVLLALSAEHEHWSILADDPPDPNFAEEVLLEPIETLEALSADLEAGVELAHLRDWAEGAAGALLASVEKFQGAVEAEDDLYALKQARSVAKYARLAAALETEVAQVGVQMSAALAGFQAEYIQGAATLMEMQGRLQPDGTGFSEAELALLEGLDVDPNTYGVLAQDILDDPVSADPLGDLDALTALTVTEASDTIAELNTLAAAADAEAAELLDLVTPVAPEADAGGPYAGNVETPITFDASGTTDPDTAIESLTFNWDMDGDGEFDDAVGVTTPFAYGRPYDGLVGVLVTDPEGHTDVAYAQATALPINSVPVVTQVLEGSRLLGTPGTQFDFSVVADDPDEDPTTTTWYLNDDVVATGTDSYSFASTVGDIGQNRVRAWVSDGQSSTPDALAEWIVMIAEVPIAGVSPPDLDFGVVLVGEPVVLAIDITNSGTVDLEITAPVLGAGSSSTFTILSPLTPISVVPEGAAQIVVEFLPTDTAECTGTVEFETNDVDSGHVCIPLSGSGTFTPGDLDHDGDVDFADFGIFAGCMAGPDNSAGGCNPDIFAEADLDEDGDVDAADFGVFQTMFTGDGRLLR